jgi:hypothetical protein
LQQSVTRVGSTATTRGAADGDLADALADPDEE